MPRTVACSYKARLRNDKSVVTPAEEHERLAQTDARFRKRHQAVNGFLLDANVISELIKPQPDGKAARPAGVAARFLPLPPKRAGLCR